MKGITKVLAVPLAFVLAFALIGAPSAPATAFLADSGAACADNGGFCYGAQNGTGCCAGFAYDMDTNGCVWCEHGVNAHGYGCVDPEVNDALCDVAAVIGLVATGMSTVGTFAMFSGIGVGFGFALIATSVPLTAIAVGGTMACLTL